MNENRIKYYVGNKNIKGSTLPIFSEIVCNFLNDLSKNLRNDMFAKSYPDVITFAYWCRKGNIQKIREEYCCKYRRIGKGLAFHIAPSNVPINFAFSLAFGLLSGNSNVVRVSSKNFEQINIICSNINKLLETEEYKILQDYITIVSYEHNKEINDYFSAECAIRIIWGGDTTIEKIRQSALRPRANEITFADRYSLSIFDEKAFERATAKELERVAQAFYNDTYLMDQNACSSPHLICWLNSDGNGRKLFWEKLAQAAAQYNLTAKKAMDKFTIACEMAAAGITGNLCIRNNYLYIATISCLPHDITNLRGKFGLFYQYDIKNIAEIAEQLTERVQTVVVYGLDTTELTEYVVNSGCAGIDRIVKPGQAMDIGIYWDGVDVIGNMSRVVFSG